MVSLKIPIPTPAPDRLLGGHEGAWGTRVVGTINSWHFQLIDSINRLIHGITRLINGITRLINGRGAWAVFPAIR